MGSLNIHLWAASQRRSMGSDHLDMGHGQVMVRPPQGPWKLSEKLFGALASPPPVSARPSFSRFPSLVELPRSTGQPGPVQTAASGTRRHRMRMRKTEHLLYLHKTS